MQNIPKMLAPHVIVFYFFAFSREWEKERSDKKYIFSALEKHLIKANKFSYHRKRV